MRSSRSMLHRQMLRLWSQYGECVFEWYVFSDILQVLQDAMYKDADFCLALSAWVQKAMFEVSPSA